MWSVFRGPCGGEKSESGGENDEVGMGGEGGMEVRVAWKMRMAWKVRGMERRILGMEEKMKVVVEIVIVLICVEGVEMRVVEIMRKEDGEDGGRSVSF